MNLNVDKVDHKVDGSNPEPLTAGAQRSINAMLLPRTVVCVCEHTGSFQNLQLLSNSDVICLHRPEILRKLLESINQRFQLQEGGVFEVFHRLSLESIRGAKGREQQELVRGALDTLLSWIGTAKSDGSWHRHIKAGALNSRDLRQAVDFALAQVTWSQHLDENCPNTSELRRLQDFICCLSPTSAECERLFSIMNMTHTELRNRLNISTVRDLMFLATVGADPFCYDAAADAETFIRKGLRKHKHKAKPTKSLHAPFFRFSRVN